MGNSVRTSSLGLFDNVSENFESCVKQNVVGNVTFWISIIDPVLNGLECWNPLRVSRTFVVNLQACASLLIFPNELSCRLPRTHPLVEYAVLAHRGLGSPRQSIRSERLSLC